MRDLIKFVDKAGPREKVCTDFEALYEPPFTDIHYEEGIDGILPEQADVVIAIVKQVNANAKVA